VGLEARIDTSEALMPYPVSRRLEMVAPVMFVAQLKEPQIPEDKDSGDLNQLPTFNAYSADGDVTAELVYVNYGIPEDYEQLAKLGIDVRGKIVIARYGRSWRGIKPKVAYEHGAVGCLIYSDPRDDGFFVGDVYPKGPTRPEQGVQRGSVMDMPIHPGDPLTPGWGAKAGGRRLDRAQADVLLKIPVLPISYGDALPLLKALGGPLAPNDDWKGALPSPITSAAGRPRCISRCSSTGRCGRSTARSRAFPEHVSRPMGDARQSPRCLGEWRGGSAVRRHGAAGDGAVIRAAGEIRMEAAAHADLRAVGR